MADASARVIVPIAEVAVEAYRNVFGRLGLLFDLAWLPLLILLAATMLPGYLHLYLGWAELPSWAASDTFRLRSEDIIQALTGLLCLNAFAVRWHQAVLFSGERPPPAPIFFAAWARFVAYTLLLYLASATLLTFLVVADGASAPVYVAPVAGLLAALLWVGIVRCSLLFPAAAFGKPLGLGEAWRSMRGNSWRLLGCGIMACTPVMVVVLLVLSVILYALRLDQTAARVPLGFFILRGLIGTFTDIIVVALGASVLSVFYRRIMLRGLGVF
jgi:hypothetical protein